MPMCLSPSPNNSLHSKNTESVRLFDVVVGWTPGRIDPYFGDSGPEHRWHRSVIPTFSAAEVQSAGVHKSGTLCCS